MAVNRKIAQQAQLESIVRYAPQVQALLQLGRDAQVTADQTVRSARGSYRGITASLKAARPQLTHAFDTAEGQRQAANALASSAVAGYPADSPWRAAQALEQGGAQTRFAESRTNSLNDLTKRALEAASGKAFAVTAATQKLGSDKARIGEQLVGLSQQQGAFTSAAVNDLLDAARRDQTTRRGQNKTLQAAQARVDATTRGQNLSHADRQAALDYKRNHPNAGKKPRTTASNDGFIQRIGSARGWIDKIRRLYPDKTPRDIRQLLSAGGKIQTGFAESTTASGKTTKHPTFETVPSFGDADVVNTAYDLHSFGYVSRPNQSRLRDRHVTLPHGWRHVPASQLTQREIHHGG